MKSVGDIFKELGFNKDASLDTQKAFLKHLISAANASTQNFSAKQQVATQSPVEVVTQEKNTGQQLEFDFSGSKRVS